LSKIVLWKNLKTAVIVNPQAGNGRIAKIWLNVESSLKKSIGSFKLIHTTCRGEAKHLTRQELQNGAINIVAVGGDGHLNEVLNGFIENDLPINSDATISFLMTGTGCDFQRSFGIPKYWQSAIDNLKRAQVRQIDVGKVTFTKSDNTKQVRYFANIASFGLSGLVDRFIEYSPPGRVLKGSPLFLWATIKSVLSHPNQLIKFQIDDGQEQHIQTRLGILANGRYFGGGMLAAPEAELDDGMLDLIILKEISLAKFLWHLPKIYKGSHLKIPEVFFKKVYKFKASSNERVILDIDGESPGGLEATFEVLPRILKMRI
tara:strand:- start:8121 stop:9071 length:951 start_codon:yes stop_codon:yes gene_type:complete